MKILIIGALPKSENEIKFYNNLAEIFQGDVITGTPVDTLNFNGTNQERFKRAIDMIDKSDIIVAECSNPSSGQGIEIGYAYSKGKEIIAIAKNGSNISGLIRGCPAVKNVVFYDDMNNLKENLKCLNL